MSRQPITARARTHPVLSIRPVDLHWLSTTPASRDLCAHAGVIVEADGVPLLDATAGELAVSTAALHLLRTLDRDHLAGCPVAEHLIPHCGHWMLVDAETGRVENGGCPHGVNWWVHHTAQGVRLEFPDGNVVTLAAAEWCRAVVALADEVEAFYAASESKEIEDPVDVTWYEAFWQEWRARREAAACAG